MEEESRRESTTDATTPSEMHAHETSVKRTEKCDCISVEGVDVVEAANGEQARCPICGKILRVVQAQSNTEATAGEPVGLVHCQAFTNRLHFLPDTSETSLDSNSSSIGELGENISGLQHPLFHAEQDFKTPVQGCCCSEYF